MKIDDVRVGVEYASSRWGRVRAEEIVTRTAATYRGYGLKATERTVRAFRVTVLSEENGQPVDLPETTLPARDLVRTWAAHEAREARKLAAVIPGREVAAALQERLRLSLSAPPNRPAPYRGDGLLLIDVEPNWALWETHVMDGEELSEVDPESAYVEIRMSAAQASLLADILDSAVLLPNGGARS